MKPANVDVIRKVFLSCKTRVRILNTADKLSLSLKFAESDKKRQHLQFHVSQFTFWTTFSTFEDL